MSFEKRQNRLYLLPAPGELLLLFRAPVIQHFLGEIDPEPNDGVTLQHPHRAITDANACGISGRLAMHTLEVQARVRFRFPGRAERHRALVPGPGSAVPRRA